MSRSFDPRRIFRQTSRRHLSQLFARKGVQLDHADDADVEPVYAAWQSLPEPARNDVGLVLQDVHELADERGLTALAQEINSRAPDRTAEFAALESRTDRALWTHLELPRAFDQAAMFARTDTLAAGRYWVTRNGLPKQSPSITNGICDRLRDALVEFYSKEQLRGGDGAVEHYRRTGGADYFFAYLSDYPDARLVFDDGGRLVKRADRYAFDVVFVFCPDDGTLSLHARGGSRLHLPLQRAFCRAVLGLDVDRADPLKPVYDLERLLDPGFSLATDPNDRIARARLARLRLEVVDRGRDLEYVELKFSPEARDAGDLIRRQLSCAGLGAVSVMVRQAGFQLTFMNDGNGRTRTMTFSVSTPGCCDLKGKPDEMRVIGERCLRLWGITQ